MSRSSREIYWCSYGAKTIISLSACVRMLDWFEYDGHICIVFELLGLSTFEVLRRNEFLPFGVEQIRYMAFQIFRAICCERPS